MNTFTPQVIDVDRLEQPLTGTPVESFTPNVERPERGAKHKRIVKLERPEGCGCRLRKTVNDVLQKPGWYVQLAVHTALELRVELAIGKRHVPGK